jgi:predicted  nucleic acid-binding Zn-ribbon protein
MCKENRDCFFLIVIFLSAGLYLGCHSGPAFTDDSAYRAIEREADRNSAELAVTGTDIASGVERIDSHAERVESGLDSLGTVILDSGLGDAEKSALLRQVAAAQREAGALRDEVGILREDAGRLNNQLAEQREISSALSVEHDKREAAAAAVRGELADTREKLVKVSGQRSLAVVIAAALALAIIGYIVIRVLRFLRIIPV